MEFKEKREHEVEMYKSAFEFTINFFQIGYHIIR